MPPEAQREIEAQEVALNSGSSWTGTILFCAFCFPFFLLAVFRIREFMFILVSGFFAACGVAAIVLQVRNSLGRHKFGDLRLHLEDPLPAVGGRLNASLKLPAIATAAGSLHANLVCMGVTYGKKQSRIEEPLRGIVMAIPLQPSATGATVTLVCDIPAGLPLADDPGQKGAVLGKRYGAWELKVTAEVEGLDLERTYAIPVGPMVPGAVLPKLDVVSAATPQESKQPVAKTFAQSDSFSVWVLVAANLVPVGGVAFFGWQVREIVMLYWIENLIIGVFNVLRIMIAVPDTLGKLAQRGVQTPPWMLAAVKAMLIGFFLMHYGGFCYLHGSALVALFPSDSATGPGRSVAEALSSMVGHPMGLATVLIIFASHAYSYLRNYVGGGEYLRADMVDLMVRPYKRIFVTQIFIIIGGLVLLGLESQVAAMVAFVVLKIAFDVYYHRQERTNFRSLPAS